MMQTVKLFFATLLTGLLVCLNSVAIAEDDVRNSVVKIEVTEIRSSPLEPWKRTAPQESSGTGVIIKGDRILTNAHVVGHARSITVQPFGSDKKYTANVEAMAPGMDLALLKVEGDDFFEDRPALEFQDKLPAARSAVNAYGFPFGGTQISVTEGIVSRVEFSAYYFEAMGLRIQIDAALNPGNSGGPAVSDGKLVGLVFSRISEGDNVGYLIPVNEIEMFLADIEDGSYDGKLKMPVSIQTLENPFIRQKLKLSDDVGGAMVTSVELPPRDLSQPRLMPWDVITAIDGIAVDREGNVKLGEDNRVSLRYQIQNVTDRNIVTFSIIRDGEAMDLDIELSTILKRLAPYNHYDKPEYFIAGPMTFIPVSADIVRALSGSSRWTRWLSYYTSPLLTRGYQKIPSDSDEQLVVTGSGFLPHPMTKGYSETRYATVKSVNGIEIGNLSQLVEVLRDCTEDFLVFEFQDKNVEKLVFPTKEFIESTEQVLDDNGIRRQGTKRFMEIWNAGD